MKYGRTEGKKIILKADIAGNVDQDELWAILDRVDSDAEEDIDNLMVDSDTEFETITDMAASLVNDVDDSNKIPVLHEISLEAVVHTEPESSERVADAEPNDTQEQLQECQIDFRLSAKNAETRPLRIKKEPGIQHVSTVGNSSVSTEIQILDPVVTQGEAEQARASTKRDKTVSSSSSTSKKRTSLDVSTLKWSKKKVKDKSIECNLSRKISFTMDGTIDVHDPVKLFYEYGDFVILCSKIATESIRYALQNGRRYTFFPFNLLHDLFCFDICCSPMYLISIFLRKIHRNRLKKFPIYIFS